MSKTAIACNKGQAGSPANDNSTFYRVELFELGELIAIRFFDGHEPLEARLSAIAAVNDCTFDEARVRDDAGRLIFRPAGPADALRA